MFKGKKVTVIVVAAGRGSRFGGDLPKQFLKIGEKTVLERAIEPFQDHPAVDGIIVAASEEYLEHCRRLCSRFDKTEAVVCGGEQRQDSVFACLERVEDGLVMVHDGARPSVTQDVIDRVIDGAYNHGASVPCVPVKDTIRQMKDSGGLLSATLDRSSLFCVQTPQGFHTQILKRAYEKAKTDGFVGANRRAEELEQNGYENRFRI